MLEETLTFFYLFDFIPVSVTSIVDILIVAFVFYQLLGLIRGTRAAQMLGGLFVMVSVAVAAPWLRMEALSWLLRQVQPILLILLVILFPPELRRILAVLGQSPVVRWFYKNEPSRVIDEIVGGAEQLAEAGYGALIVVGREVGLGPVIATGVQINAEVSADLLSTIFTPRSTLHDQAVVIQGETLVSARCTLPLAEEVEDEKAPEAAGAFDVQRHLDFLVRSPDFGGGQLGRIPPAVHRDSGDHFPGASPSLTRNRSNLNQPAIINLYCGT